MQTVRLLGTLLWAFIIAGAADVAQAQDVPASRAVPAPSQVGPPVIPTLPQAPPQIPALEPSEAPSFPKCRGAPEIECESPRQNPVYRRRHRAN
jgi:hypothetical protein